MRLYVRSMRLFFTITIVFSVICLILHFSVSIPDSDFWCNVALTIAGGGLISLATACMGYFDERRKTLENFYYHTKELLGKLDIWFARQKSLAPLYIVVFHERFAIRNTKYGGSGPF